MQIIKGIIGIEGFPCKVCGGVDWEEEEVKPEKDWLHTFLEIPKSRGDPEKGRHMNPNKDFSNFEKHYPNVRKEGKC